MKDHDKDSEPKIPELRRQAELALAEKSLAISNVSVLSPEKVQQLIHELQVHQIELEMQNEELCRTQQELEASRDKYFELYEFAPSSYFIVDQNGVILEANLTASSLLGVERAFLIGKPLATFVSEEGGNDLYLHFRQVLATQSKQTCDIQLTKKDGSQIQARLDSFVLRSQDGSTKVLRTAVTDITSRKQLEEALHASEVSYRRLFESTRDGVLILDFDSGKILDVNQYLTGMLGYAREEFLERCIWEIRAFSNTALNRTVFAELRQKGYVRCEDLPIETRDGRSIHVEFVGNSYLVHGMAFIQCHVHDITDRKQAWESLAKANTEWERTFNSISDLIMVLDDRHRILRANKAMADAVGMTGQELIGKLCFDVVHGGREPPVSCPHSQLLADGEEHSAEVMEPRLGGTYDLRVSPLVDQNGQAMGSVHIARDITVRKQSEETLRVSEELYRAVFANAGIGIDLLDRDGKILQANQSLLNMLGYTEEEFSRLSFYDITHPDDRQISKESLEALAEGKVSSYRFEKRYVKKDRGILWADLSASGIRDGKGEHAGTIGVIADITERKESQLRVERSEERLRLIIESSPIGITIVQEGKYAYVNPRFVEIFGYESAKELLALPVEATYLPDSIKLIVQKAVGRDSGTKSIAHYDAIGVSKSGQRMSVAAWVTEIEHLGKQAYLAFVMDLTESKSIRSQLLQAQKMEAIGNLAGGIAHDFNNLLTVIQGYSELLLFDENIDDQMKPDLERMHNAARSGADLIQRLLVFSRKSEIKTRPMILNSQIVEITSLLSRTIPKTISIELRLADEIPQIEADPVQVEQILMNLAVNAKHAMPNGGHLVMETRQLILEHENTSSHLGVKPGNYVLVTVSDTGEGIAEEAMEHIFEPFFTTKSPDKGTGLGLSVVYGIIKQHGGHVICDSQRGVGTTFRIYFPVVETKIQLRTKKQRHKIPSGTERILLVDDERDVRDLGARILSGAGYTVLTAANGREALDIFRKERQKIAVVILDLIMPVMDGHQCLRDILQIDQQARIIVSSAYSADGLQDKMSLSGAKGVVAKPYDMDEMLATVRNVLDSD
jgi:two-component system, cell cycle sensor histidine kinase and response regulator CckA